MSKAWTHPLRLHEISRGPVKLTLEPDAETRLLIARQLDIKSLPALAAKLTIKPWMDGAEISGQFKAMVEQVCSLSLEPFKQPLQGEIFRRVVPNGSPHGAELEGGELDLDLEAPDPPDVLEGDMIDLAHYVVEQLALDIDPFPRKPGATFDFTPPPGEDSPFAVLKNLKDPKG